MPFLWSNGRPTATAAVPRIARLSHGSGDERVGDMGDRSGGRLRPSTMRPWAAQACRSLPLCRLPRNSRSNGVWTVASTNLVFDHTIPVAMADCGTCHQSSSAAAQWSSWAGGKYHLAGDATPATCLPCHAGERPTTTSNWKSATYASIPFDYGTNAQRRHPWCWSGLRRLSLRARHRRLGRNANWVGGTFTHGAGTLSSNTCISCHSSQRPDLLSWTTPAAMATLLNFDHSINGTGDCSGCHQARSPP